jgi:hypothetical protein
MRMERLYPPDENRIRGAARLGMVGAAATLVGILLSGPLAVWLVNATHPQPPWAGPELFARSFHPIQILPYPGGIVLVAGLVLLIAGARAAADDAKAALADAALVFCAVSATMVCLNYVLQTTFVPVLASEHRDSDAALLAALSMSNPKSLAWALEMWGWGFLGVATWLVAPGFRGGRLERATRWAFVANGLVSIAGAVWTVLRPGWVMTGAGLIVFALWNLLLLAMAWLALLAFRRRLGGRMDARLQLPSRPAAS